MLLLKIAVDFYKSDFVFLQLGKMKISQFYHKIYSLQVSNVDLMITQNRRIRDVEGCDDVCNKVMTT